jgi:hypothetical protein
LEQAVIVDAILYAGERECLEIRVAEYEGLVDKHLLIEGTHTFQGQEREITPFEELMAISPKIERAIFSQWVASTPFEREAEQRNSIKACVRAGDWILISDADEIVRHEVLEKALMVDSPARVVSFDLDQFYYRLNLKDEAETVLTPRLIRYEYLTQVQFLRRLRPNAHERVIPKAGWHFGWLGDVPRLQKKLKAFAHQELNTPELTDEAFLRGCIQSRFTLHNGHLLTKVPIDETFPRLVRESPERFEGLIEK